MRTLGGEAAHFIARSAQVMPNVSIGDQARIWDLAQVREFATIGAHTTIGRGVYIDRSVVVGERCKVQNGAQLFSPARIGDGVFIGPSAILANDRYPRAINADGTLKDASDWDAAGVTLEDGVSIGAGSIVLGGTTIERWAFVGAGAVVTRDVAPHALMVGSPAQRIGWVGRSGRRMAAVDRGCFVDDSTGDRFIEHDGRLVPAQ